MFHPFPDGVESTTTPRTVLINVDLVHKDKTLPTGLHQALTGVVFADSEEQTEDALSEDARSEDARSKAVEEPDFGSDSDTWPDWRKEAKREEAERARKEAVAEHRLEDLQDDRKLIQQTPLAQDTLRRQKVSAPVVGLTQATAEELAAV
jgi:hypothetical protein